MARADMYNDYSGETFAYASPTSYTLNDSTYIALDADDFKSYDSVILILGKQNENNSRQIRFDISDWIEQFGEGTVQLNVKKPDAFDSYTVPLSREGNEAIWIVSSYDVDIPGKGLAELTYTFNNTEIIKSVTFGTVIFASISADSGTDEDNIYSARIGTNDLTYLTKDVDDFYSYDSNILILGKQGENHSRKITFNLTQWQEEFGEGVLSLLVRRPSELSSYPVVLDMQDDLAIWNISNIDTAIFGKGLAELCYTYGNNQLAKSVTFGTVIYPTISSTEQPVPDPYESWVETLVKLGTTVQGYAITARTAADESIEAKEYAQEAARKAEIASQRYPYINEDTHTWMVWDVTLQQYIDTQVSAEGKGTSNYESLENLPILNGRTVIGNKTSHDYGLADEFDTEAVQEIGIDAVPVEGSINLVRSGGVYRAIKNAKPAENYYIKPDDGIPYGDLNSSIQDNLDLASRAIQPEVLDEYYNANEIDNLLNDKQNVGDYATNQYVNDEINDLQGQIDAIVSQSDVFDIVGTYEKLLEYDTSQLHSNSIIKVLSDETHNNARSYYKWQNNIWVYVGSESISYTKQEADILLNEKQGVIDDLSAIRNNASIGATHSTLENNPHKVTKVQVGLGNVPNVSTNDQTPTFELPINRQNLQSGDNLSTLMGKTAKWFSDLNSMAFESKINYWKKNQLIINSDAELPTQKDLESITDAASGIKYNISTIPTKISSFENDSGYLTKHQDISGKVDKVEGKGLSTEDYTTEEKAKLNDINIDEIKSDLTNFSLGIHTDGLLYIFHKGKPIGNGISLPGGVTGDAMGNMNSKNN